jgi:molecular chaperone DnaJ
VKGKIEQASARKILRLRKGLPDVNGCRRRFTVKIHAWVPQKLTSEERRTLEKLQSSPNFEFPEGNRDKNFFDKVKDMFD